MRRLSLLAVATALVVAPAASCFDWKSLTPTTDASALKLGGGCAFLDEPLDASTIKLSDDPFSVSFWMRLDDITAGPIVWQGGTQTGESGWSIAITSTPLLAFCIVNASATPACVHAPIIPEHLIHVVATSAPGSTFGRTQNLYTLDWTAGQSKHTLAASSNNAVNGWATASVFTLGGAYVDGGCTRMSHATLASVRIWTTELDAGTLATDYVFTSDCTASPGLLAYYHLDEGSGATAADCTKNQPPLTLTTPVARVPSPFP